MSEESAKANTDRELWREFPDCFYSNSIHVTEAGGIGINVRGRVIVRTLEQWHAMAAEIERLRVENEDIGRRLGLLSGDLDAQKMLVHEARGRLEDAKRENADLRSRSPNGPPRERSDFEKDMV